MDKKRVEYIDIARGIAMLCIVLGHLGNSNINRVVFTFHVPLFFFITGYFTTDKLPVRDFIKNKARTLLIPYCCTCLVIILIAFVRSGIIYGGAAAGAAAWEWFCASLYGAGDSYSEPFTIKGIGAIWFLWATFWGSTFLRYTLEMKKGTRIVTIMILFALGSWSRKLLWLPFSIQAGCCAVLFMYFGFLLKGSIKEIKKISLEMKAMVTVFAIWIWVAFMKNFQSFWLVHCDIGRGGIDIFGCICGCYIVILFSWYLEKHSAKGSKILAFLGRNSLFMLCLHIVELDMFPWWWMAQKLIAYGMPANLELCMTIIGKFIFIISGTVICANWNFVRKLFGLAPMERKGKRHG